jgi:hypothetical protein
MYANVALSLTVLEPSAGSLMEHVNQGCSESKIGKKKRTAKDP